MPAPDSNIKAAELFDLTGRVALVSGGGRGLGRAMAFGLAEAGAKVVVAGRTQKDLAETVSELRTKGFTAEALQFEATDTEDVVRMVSKATSLFGSLDVYVNSHGVGDGAPAEMLDDETWNKVINIDLTSAFVCTREVAKVMLEQERGSIILISSDSSAVTFYGGTAYGAAKAGVDHMARHMAFEWAERGVRVNVISPGFMTSHMRGTEEFYNDPEYTAQVLERTPMKRKGEARELIGPAVFLASDASSFVTGHVIPVDGGWMLE